ncbi:MAG: hypothetical protein HC783_09215 [Rhodobacteraceae bacterium]|nr:hypothetical protein [Paracoccaceae bacterium]
MNLPTLMIPLLLAAAQVTVLAGGAVAQEGAASEAPFLSIELNMVEPQENTCRLTFVAQNGLGADASAVVFETVLFDREGQVIDLTLFDFQDLPEGSPRVRQFDLGGVACGSVGRVLLNDVHACSGPGLTPEICAAGLRWSSRTDVEVMG